ncbi:MAG TPA: hypothetical protein VNI83_06065 [Vicinamibacterales bacterium]|nr:hypothetical protein [Vicinamibacterales bacterium]
MRLARLERCCLELERRVTTLEVLARGYARRIRALERRRRE